MARIRSIKPEIRISEKVNSWPIEVRYFWIMLWGYCDDHGRGRDNAKLIVADSFPLDDSVTHKDVERWLTLLEKSGVIRRYMVDGSKYLLITNWLEHQRPSHPAKSVIPAPQAISGNPPQAAEDCGGLPEPAVNGSPEQGAESSEQGAETQVADAPATTISADFEEAWTLYPLKKEKKYALTSYKKALGEVSHETIMKGVMRYKADPGRDPKFTKNFSTWLNRGCWNDEVTQPQLAPAQVASQHGWAN